MIHVYSNSTSLLSSLKLMMGHDMDNHVQYSTHRSSGVFACNVGVGVTLDRSLKDLTKYIYLLCVVVFSWTCIVTAEVFMQLLK